MKFWEKEPRITQIKKSRAVKTIRAFAVGAAITAGADQVNAQGMPMEIDQNLDTIAKMAKWGTKLETENDWIEFAEKSPDHAMSLIPEILDVPYAEHIVEVIVNKYPRLALQKYESYKKLIDADKILAGAIRNLLNKDEAIWVLTHYTDFSHLSNAESYLL